MLPLVVLGEEGEDRIVCKLSPALVRVAAPMPSALLVLVAICRSLPHENVARQLAAAAPVLQFLLASFFLNSR